MERFGQKKEDEGQNDTDIGDKKQSRRCSSDEVNFSKTNLKKIANLAPNTCKKKKKGSLRKTA